MHVQPRYASRAVTRKFLVNHTNPRSHCFGVFRLPRPNSPSHHLRRAVHICFDLERPRGIIVEMMRKRLLHFTLLGLAVLFCQPSSAQNTGHEVGGAIADWAALTDASAPVEERIEAEERLLGFVYPRCGASGRRYTLHLSLKAPFTGMGRSTEAIGVSPLMRFHEQ